MGRRRQPIELTETLAKVNVPSMISDRNGTITWLNDAATASFGDLLGQPFSSIVAPEYIPTVRRELERKLGGVPATDYQVDVFTADGQRRRAEISSVRIRSRDRCHAIFGVVLPGGPRAAAPAVRLTARQTEVLQLLGQGASTDEIAAALHLSKETVRNHIRHILRELGAHSRLEAVALAHRYGLLPNR